MFDTASSAPGNGGETRLGALRGRLPGRAGAGREGSRTLKKPLRFDYGLHDSESRTARGSIAGLPSGAPLTTLGLQATLRNSSTGELLAPTNGGSCKVMGGIVVP